MPAPTTSFQSSREYPTGELVRRLLALAWHYRADFLLSMVLSLVLLLLGLLGLQLLGVVIDVIRHALDPSLQAPHYPFGWRPPASWTPVQIVTALALAIMAQAGLRAILTYHYNLSTARLTQAEIVPDLRDKLYARLQRLSFHFFDVHGSSSIFNRVTGDVQNTRLFVDGVLLQGLNMLLTLAAYAVFMWHIHPGLTLACLWVALPLWWVTDYYSRRLRPAYLRNRELSDDLVQLFTESVKGMQTIKGFAAERPQIRRFEEGNQRVSAQHFYGPVRLHAADAIALASQPGDSFRLWRLAVSQGGDTAGFRPGGVRRPAATIQRAGGQYLQHRQLGAAKPGGGPARV
jgi:ATP-binding cassette subfamily B protein